MNRPPPPSSSSSDSDANDDRLIVDDDRGSAAPTTTSATSDTESFEREAEEAREYNADLREVRSFFKVVLEFALLIFLVLLAPFLVLISVQKSLVLASLLCFAVTWMMVHLNAAHTIAGMGGYLFVWFYWTSYSFGNFLLSQRSSEAIGIGERHDGIKTPVFLVLLTLFVYIPVSIWCSLKPHGHKMEVYFRSIMYGTFVLHIFPFENNNLFFDISGGVVRVMLASALYISTRYRLRQLSDQSVDARCALASSYLLFGAYRLSTVVGLFHVSYVLLLYFVTRKAHQKLRRGSDTGRASDDWIVPPALQDRIDQYRQVNTPVPYTDL